MTYVPPIFCKYPSPVFPGGKSPRLIQIVVSAVTCLPAFSDLNPNGHHSLNQLSETLWHSAHTPYLRTEVIWDETGTSVEISDYNGNWFFKRHVTDPCETYFGNGTRIGIDAGYGGSVQICWGAEIGGVFGYTNTRDLLSVPSTKRSIRISGNNYRGISYQFYDRIGNGRVQIRRQQFQP